MEKDIIIKKLEEHDERFEKVDKRLDRQMVAILDNREDINWIKENIVTKDNHQEVISRLDEIVLIVSEIREDHFFAIEWLKKHELRIANLEART